MQAMPDKVEIDEQKKLTQIHAKHIINWDTFYCIRSRKRHKIIKNNSGFDQKKQREAFNDAFTTNNIFGPLTQQMQNDTFRSGGGSSDYF